MATQLASEKKSKMSKPNPVWKYLGFGENFRPRVPSRNWCIFLAVVGSFTTAVIYDKREKKRNQRKWCKMVEHIAKEPLNPRAMPRKLTVFLEAPPTDGLRVSQDHFKEYVKPILVASGLDWEFVQGRQEGDIRFEIAERIRNSRRPLQERVGKDTVAEIRSKNGVEDFQGPRGDIVLGRHTWKEYVRGVHEGWLGPLTEPPRPAAVPDDREVTRDSPPETLPGITVYSSKEEADRATAILISGGLDSDSKDSDSRAESTSASSIPAASSKSQTSRLPFISTIDYSTISMPQDIPFEFDPSTPIPFPHILGFLNTPKRLYRFLNRRVLADQIGRETAAVILSTYRPYYIAGDTLASSLPSDEAVASPPHSDLGENMSLQTSETQVVLIDEEKEWPKSVRLREESEPERTWLEPIVTDLRIVSRMRRFELSVADEERSRKIRVPEEEVEGWIKGNLRHLGRSVLQYIGYCKARKTPLEGKENILE